MVFSDHPARHGGFSTVGANVTASLQRLGGWDVAHVARQPARDRDDAPPQEWIRDLQPLCPRGRQTPLISIGTAPDQRLLLEALEESGMRPRVRLIVYTPFDFAPLPPGLESVLDRFDVVVPFTEHARRALLPSFRHLAASRLGPPIVFGVDCGVFRPSDPEARRIMRRERMGVGDDATVVGFFGRNSGHKHAELALRIFRAFARGDFARCSRCEAITPFDVDPIDFSVLDPRACRRCRDECLIRGEARPTARLYLHVDASPAPDAGGWDLDLLAERLGIEDRVVRDRTIRLGEGVAAQELASRMSACDVHLLPFDCGAFELTVLETGACGVPNVITDVEAPREYAAPFSELVPPAWRWIGPHGSRGYMDVGLGIEALVRLADDPARRAHLGKQGIEVARQHAWENIARRWSELLETMIGNGTRSGE